MTVELGVNWDNAKGLADQVVRELLQPAAKRGNSRSMGLKSNPVVTAAVIRILEEHPGVFIYMEWGEGENTTISMMKKTDLRRAIKKHDILAGMTSAREFRDEQELPELRSTLSVIEKSWNGRDKLADSAREAIFGRSSAPDVYARPPDPPDPDLCDDGPGAMAELRKHLGIDPDVKPGAAERVARDRTLAKTAIDELRSLHERAEVVARVASHATDIGGRKVDLAEQFQIVLTARDLAVADYELLCTKSVETETQPLGLSIAEKLTAARAAFGWIESTASTLMGYRPSTGAP